jgi:hypothetical protein
MASVTTGASFKVGAATIAEVASASFAITRQSIDVTPLGNTHRHHEPGILEGTATIELFYDSTDHATMMANFESGTVLNEAEIVWASGKSVKGKALIQDFSMTVAPNGVAQATVVLQFTQNAITVTE